MSVRLSDELVEFVESGVSMFVGTRSADLRPEVMRAVGAFAGQDRQSITMFVPEALASRTLANIADNGQITTTFSRIIDHRTMQAKGVVRVTRPGTVEERAIQERWLAAFSEQLYCVGMPRALAHRLRYWPSVAVELEVRELFHQTPGPGAGRKMAPDVSAP